MSVGLLGSVREGVADAVGWLAGAVDWLGSLLDPVGKILAGIWPPVLAAIAAIALLRTVRWLLLLWRGRTPRVQISNFAWAMSDDASREATWVTSLFREQLAALRLDALDPLPERAPGAPLVEIVEGVGQGVGRDIASAAGRLFKAAWPDSAYEVWGTLRPREGGGGRISVQLIERRRGNRTLLNVALEEASWENGAREAALAVAGALYPEVRRSERGPWTLWKRTVPRSLMDHYHSARRHEEANRLEHALAEYHAALDQDPLNPNLRLKIAMLQERLELYLDAWVTYEAIVDESDRRAWRGPDRRAYLLALFRLAVMLSNGRVAAQWVKGASLKESEMTLRDKERDERRHELLRSLESASLFASSRINPSRNELPEPFTRTVSTLITRFPSSFLLSILRTIDLEAKEPSDALDAFRRGGEYEEREQRIEAVLQILGLRRLEELETAQRIHPLHPRQWLSRPEFARSAIKISKLLVRTRIAASLESQVERRSSASASFRSRDRWIEEIREAHRKLTRHWPFPAVGPWRTAIHFLAPRRRWANLREDSWQLHYNAACTAASVLRDDSVLRNSAREGRAPEPSQSRWRPWRRESDRWMALPSGIDRDRIVKRAIDQLEEYAFKAGSDRVAAQADWVALDDPDLRGLRRSAAFKLWASHHLPRALPEGISSRKADVKRFTVRVVQEGACLLAASWRERANRPNPTAAEIVDWWRVEAQVWSALGNACREHLSWQERLKWLETLQEWLRAAERDDEVDFSYEVRGTAAADSMSAKLFDELATLVSDEPSGNGTASRQSAQCVLAWVDERKLYVRGAHESGEERADAGGTLRAKAERDEALKAARVWTHLADALEVELTKPCRSDSAEELQTREEQLRESIELIRGLLSTRGVRRREAIPRQVLARFLPPARNR
jgi:tetratricopeptide (TPR) repeat protein